MPAGRENGDKRVKDEGKKGGGKGAREAGLRDKRNKNNHAARGDVAYFAATSIRAGCKKAQRAGELGSIGVSLFPIGKLQFLPHRRSPARRDSFVGTFCVINYDQACETIRIRRFSAKQATDHNYSTNRDRSSVRAPCSRGRVCALCCRCRIAIYELSNTRLACKQVFR